MSSEYHLVVLWERAQPIKPRVLADLRAHATVLAVHEVSEWPLDPNEGFNTFYGIKLPSARGKVKDVGAGPFTVIVIRDDAVEWGLRETSRGTERVNITMFDRKQLYRSWTTGGSKVHTTNSEEETRHDILLLTGHTLDEWKQCVPQSIQPFACRVQPWRSIRELFAFLNQTLRYVVLRNDELLPDGFDPSLHGDIDLLVESETDIVNLLGARKVFPDPHRVHYEVMVGDRPLRFDFRHLGDGYYDELWERDILATRILKDGFYAPAPEHAFYSLFYHAFVQKRSVAPDYPGKLVALAKAAGVPGEGMTDYLPAFERWMAKRHYRFCRPEDSTVFFHQLALDWCVHAREAEKYLGCSNLVPYAVQGWNQLHFGNQYFLGTYEGREVFIKYSGCDKGVIQNEYRFGKRLAAEASDFVPRAFGWHVDRSGVGGYLMTERVVGVPLDELLADCKRFGGYDFARIADGLARIIATLAHAGIVHRDIKPANFIVLTDSSVKLIDFEFAVSVANYLPSNERFACSTRQVFRVLGDRYRKGEGVWNDAYSARLILREFPDSASKAVTAADRDLRTLAEDPMLTIDVTDYLKHRLNHGWVRFRNRILGRK